MIDLKTLEGKPRPVTRAKYDWQVYDPARKEKGGVRWYTVEGPTVLKRKGKYFEMFSGGNWQNKTYGVSFAVSDRMNFTDEWQQFSDGEKILPILRTIPDKVVGPGHNSVVRGPNNRELYCIYHRWTETGRVLAIDRMDFAGDRLFVAGPTTTEQPSPFRPLENESLLRGGLTGWLREGDELISTSDEDCQLSISVPHESFLFECTVRSLDPGTGGHFAIEIGETRFELSASENKAALVTKGDSGEINLRADFDSFAWHLLRVEKDGRRCSVMIDDISQRADVISTGKTEKVEISSSGGRTAISAIQLTPGFEELFESEKLPSQFRVDGKANISDGKLVLKANSGKGVAEAIFPVTFAEFDLAINLAAGDSSIDEYGVKLLNKARPAAVAQLIARPLRKMIEFTASSQTVSIDLPDSFVGDEFRQFRLVHQSGRLSAHLDGILLSDLGLITEVTEAVIFGTSEISVEMVRATSL
jgi:hypothetical protein